MKFSLILFFFFFLSCSAELTNLNQKKIYTAKGFAYIYNDNDFDQKIIKGKINDKVMQISHQYLKTGTLLQLTNPKNNKSITLKNVKRIKYPDFYKVLITLPVANKLELNKEFPIIEVIEIKRNKSFVAEKAKIYTEEKKISSKAPVATVKISNISKNKKKTIKKKPEKLFIQIATFYSVNTAKFMKERIINEVPDLNEKKLKIQKINNKETQVIMGPYTSVNLLKNDYIKLKSFGFEELDIYIDE